jgi:hypothetical protein
MTLNVYEMRLIKFEEGSGYCGKCLKQVPVSRARIRHLPYILFTIATLGFGAVIWIRDAQKNIHGDVLIATLKFIEL